MHAMERAIVERLNLESGDEVGFSFKQMPLIQGKAGTPVPAMINGTFNDIICDDKDHVVIMIDLKADGGKVIHTAIDVDSICQIGKLSEIETSTLHTMQ